MSDEHEDLQNLITHPGWLRWRDYIKTQWGARAYAEKLDTAATADDPVFAVKTMRVAKDAVMAVVGWPEERVKFIEQQKEREAEPVSQSRRGPL